MTDQHRLFAASIAVSSFLGAACGPLRLDDRPQIYGRVVSVEADTVGVKHKTGGTYYVDVTPDTKVTNKLQPGSRTLCPGQRATVFLARDARLTASSITLWSGKCR